MGIFHSSTNIQTFDGYVCRYLRANTRAELNQIIQDVKNDPDISDAFNTPEYENTTLYYSFENWSETNNPYILEELINGVELTSITKLTRGSLEELETLPNGYHLIYWR